MPDPAEFPSFFDIEEVDLGAVDEPKPEPEAKPEATPAAPAAAPAAPQGADFFARLAEFDQQKEHYRLAREAQEQQAAARRAQWEELYKPPAPPVEKDKLVLEPDALLDYFAKNQQWTEKVLRAQAMAMSQIQQNSLQNAAQARGEATLAARQIARVDRQVAKTLRDEGFQNVEDLIDAADEALMSDPSRYLDYRTSPDHFAGAVRFMASQQPPAKRQGSVPAQQVASGTQLPYNPSAPTPNAGVPVGMSREDIARAQRAFGVKISPDRLRQSGAVVV